MLTRSLTLTTLLLSSSSARSFSRYPMSSPPSLDSGTLYVDPTIKHGASVVLLHGLGDSAEGWIDVAEQLAPMLPHVRFVLPSASDKPVSMNGGMRMPSWYDIKGLGPRSQETCDGLEGSVGVVKDLIAREVASGIPQERIVLAGFSQGGAMSVWVGLQLEKRLAGVVCMSGYLPRPELFRPTAQGVETPLLMCHGTSDDVVQHQWAKQSEALIKEAGVKSVVFKTYERMGHSACAAEIQDVYQFLSKIIG